MALSKGNPLSHRCRGRSAIPVPAIARQTLALAAHIFSRCTIRILDVKAGSTVGVFTEKGYIRTDAVVLASGVWSRPFRKELGIRLSQLIVQPLGHANRSIQRGLQDGRRRRHLLFPQT